MNFEDFGLAEPVLKAIRAEGYTVPTPIQVQAIAPILEGRDVVGCAQTGTGKTAAFALPILHSLLDHQSQPRQSRPIRVLVLASTRELALQISESFATYGSQTALRVGPVYGGVGQEPQVRMLRKGVDVLIATPGRLLDLMEQGYIHLEHIQTLVLDEADRMLDMGFLPAIKQILRNVPVKRQTLLFSATMPPAIKQLVDSILRNPLRISIEPARKATELVEQWVYHVPQQRKMDRLIDLFGQIDGARVLVFSRTKHGADRIVRQLEKAGIRSDAIHSNKSQNRRQRILDDFKRDKLSVLVATDIASRGIDVEGISHVVNFDMPEEPETYIHRIGRSGRAGATGNAISLCDSNERKYLRDIERLIGKQIQVRFAKDEPASARPRTNDSSTDSQQPTRSNESDDSDQRRSDDSNRHSHESSAKHRKLSSPPTDRTGDANGKPRFGKTARPFRSKFKPRAGTKPFRGPRRKSARV